jgi:hypothetical protein
VYCRLRTHLHHRRLQEADADDVAADAADLDAIPGGEVGPPQDREVPGERGDDALQREREPHGQQPGGRGQVLRIVEPDRQHAEHQEPRGHEVEALPAPEARALAGAAAPEGPRGGPRTDPHHQEDGDEEEREQELASALRVHADQPDAEQIHGVPPAPRPPGRSLRDSMIGGRDPARTG